MNIASCFHIPLTPDFSQVYWTWRHRKTVSTVLDAHAETVETVSPLPVTLNTPLKWGVNERTSA